jgi:hypothetical protein
MSADSRLSCYVDRRPNTVQNILSTLGPLVESSYSSRPACCPLAALPARMGFGRRNARTPTTRRPADGSLGAEPTVSFCLSRCRERHCIRLARLSVGVDVHAAVELLERRRRV